ncbi:DUF3488 domain-containing protein [Lactobacillus gasseri]|uniref:hypothetical protein n=1 Tax=Lactobacillus gasseri TaxID=1596 RepID=UPI000763EC6F|nr:hypothetical protein [Lactobacillus gasseri]DAX25185.1 MAG TPA: hypothetical protein [Bacteriophage sp.]KXA25079.1 hypothetical protein HMPREF3210_01337 [Lactobacillus gasseri]MCZ3484184.1 DUF3488 domain-containing protein [Lactobacillus gasseri]MCZ3484969.1 DUF3488 domain-containing protein [Lactobacillus gasseri]MCZ3492904.1 DUF3488 domain-containing protein [Lactobacillus gasseri]
MSNIFTWIFMLIFVVSALPLYFAWQSVKEKKQPTLSKKALKLSGAISAISLVLMLVTIFVFPSKSDQVSEESNNNYSSSQKSSKEDNNRDSSSNDESNIQIKKANNQLVQDLKGNQDDANNGNHNYDYSTYVEKIDIKSDTQAYVYVDESFMNLDDAAKTKVGNSISNLVLRSMATSGMDIQPEDQKRGIYLAFYTGGNKALGHSRFTNYNEYKFY